MVRVPAVVVVPVVVVPVVVVLVVAVLPHLTDHFDIPVPLFLYLCINNSSIYKKKRK